MTHNMKIWRSLHGVVANVLGYDIIISGFKLRSLNNVHFQANNLGERNKHPYPLSYGLNSTTTIKSLQDNNNIIILPADKGNATLVMDRVEYSNKLPDLIGNDGYCKVKKNPTLKMERKLSQVLGKNKDLIPQAKYRQLIQHYSKLPYICGLPKIHKDGIPLRPIVSNWGSACHPLSHFLVEIINPLTGKSSSYVKNSAHVS